MKKRLITALAVAALGGCGLETASTAATSAAIKKQEIEQARNIKQQAQQQLDQAMELQRQQQQRQAESADK